MSRIDFHRPARVACPQLPTNPVVLAAPPQPVGRDGGASWLYLLMPLLSSFSVAGYMIVAGKKALIFLGIGFVLISVVLWAGSFNMQTIVLAQKGEVLGIINANGFNPLLFPMSVVFLISSMAETSRTPFDLTEAESELVAGYQTEYSSMSFALYWLGEYANVILMCALNATLFWGGWLPPLDLPFLYHIPGTTIGLGLFWMFFKMAVFFFIFSWVKATLPRYRYDQLMRLGWKIFLPLSLLFVFLVSGWLMLTRFHPIGA